MSEMIHRVARAIMETDIAMTLADYPDMPADIGRQSAEAMYETHYVPVARAAIEALREPTDGMLEAGMHQPFPGESPRLGVWECIETWVAMVDTALSEGRKP